MEIIPAIDLRAGRCVQLVQGDYSRETIFSEDPVEMARRWEEQGAPRLHVVDLDGARDGRPKNLSVVADICAAVGLPVQLGGGIRNELTASRALDVGVQRVIVGTAALNERTAEGLLRSFGDSIVIGIDARDGKVAVRGWLDTTDTSAVDLARKLAGLGLARMVYTDIGTDEMIAAVPKVEVIASGGITSVEDVRALRKAGAVGVIIGTALYTGKLTLEEALEAAC
jgi:phosphoribosylformimino-5-aminoimidazole carboxamide ribotide isomerase